MTKTSPLKKNKHEILWNLINCGLAGMLVFFGAFADGNISARGIMAAITAALIVFITKFKDYWSSEKKEYQSKIFSFVC